MRGPGLADMSTDIAKVVLDLVSAPVLCGHSVLTIYMSLPVGSVGTYLQTMIHYRRNNVGRREACLTWQHARSFEGSTPVQSDAAFQRGAVTTSGVHNLHQRDALLSVQALVHARYLTASQVPIILWAFTVLRYNPVVAVLSALDQQIEMLSGQMTAQVS